MKPTVVHQIIKDIRSYNNAIFQERIDNKDNIVIKFMATNFAGKGIAYHLKKQYGIRVLKWRDGDEYFFVIEKK